MLDPRMIEATRQLITLYRRSVEEVEKAWADPNNYFMCSSRDIAHTLTRHNFSSCILCEVAKEIKTGKITKKSGLLESLCFQCVHGSRLGCYKHQSWEDLMTGSPYLLHERMWARAAYLEQLLERRLLDEAPGDRREFEV